MCHVPGMHQLTTSALKLHESMHPRPVVHYPYSVPTPASCHRLITCDEAITHTSNRRTRVGVADSQVCGVGRWRESTACTHAHAGRHGMTYQIRDAFVHRVGDDAPVDFNHRLHVLVRVVVLHTGWCGLGTMPQSAS